MADVPVLAHDREELRAAITAVGGGRVALVPTMGALHEGHAALMARARREVGAGPVVASVFVNPTQFAPGEDLDRYPRTLDADLQICADQGVDVVFAPGVAQMYPDGPEAAAVTVAPGPLGRELEGASRPTHFAGVLSVVAKLFGLVRPDVAVFGEKDYQQLVLIRRMVADLCLGLDVVGVETVRERDGLALSSRNRYLGEADREAALALHGGLQAAASAATGGAQSARAAALEVLAARPEVDLDYLALTDPGLGPAPASGPARILVAARVGTTRLIDNLPITIGASTGPAGGDHTDHQPETHEGDS